MPTIVRRLRLERGWTQEQLAELSGLSVRSIQRIERGQSCSLESRNSLAAVFEIERSALTSEADIVKAVAGKSKPGAIAQTTNVRRWIMNSIAKWGGSMAVLAGLALFAWVSYDATNVMRFLGLEQRMEEAGVAVMTLAAAAILVGAGIYSLRRKPIPVALQQS